MDTMPPELIYKVLKSIGDDRTTVRNLSLVSSTLTGPCQKHLFTTVTIRPPSHSYPGASSVLLPSRQKLQASPGVDGEKENPEASRARRIESIVAHPQIKTYVEKISILDGYTGPFKSWLKNADLGFAMKQLSEAATITHFTFWKQVADTSLQDALSADLMQAIIKICRSPALRSISLLNNMPLRLLDLCGPSLKYVALEGSMDLRTPTWMCEQSSPVYLASLKLTCGELEQTIDYLINPSMLVDISCLRYLSATVKTKLGQQLSRLLKHCPALEELVIRASPSITTDGKLWPIRQFQEVALITCFFRCHLYKSAYRQLSWVVSSLNTISPTSELKFLKLEMDVKMRRLVTTSPYWEQLDQLLAGKNSPFSLASVKIDIQNYEDRSMYGETQEFVADMVTAEIKKCLPQIASRKDFSLPNGRRSSDH